jgi:hypothetical protein
MQQKKELLYNRRCSAPFLYNQAAVFFPQKMGATFCCNC